MTVPTSAPPAKNSRPVPYPFLFRWLHWLLVPSTLVLILTGFSLHAGARPDWSLLDGKVPGWFWTGRVHYWHAWAAIVFAPSILAACWIYLRRRVFLRPTHVILLAGGLLLLPSGYFLANPPTAEWLYWASIWIHAVLGLAVVPIWFLWHLLTGLTRYARLLVPAFHPWASPQWLSCLGFLLLAAGTSCILMNGWPWRLPWNDLVAARIVRGDVGDLTGLPWDQARPLQVQLANGSGMDAGRTLVTLRALHDGEELFVEATWADDDEDYDYWPWKKTDDGWEYLQTNEKDECRRYEDKFTLFFPVEPSGDFERFGCAASCHLHGDFGWGYKGSNYRLDTWHWKAARTGAVGQADDQYCDVADLSRKKVGRYEDPSDGGGYVENRKPELDRPPFLPDAPDAAFQGAIPKARAVKYEEAAKELLAGFAPGDIVPGVIVEAFRGDRGDVRSQSQWRDGRWTLYMRRKLATGSEFDTQFAPGGCYAFGCAAFDRANKRHAYALPTFHLRLEE